MSESPIPSCRKLLPRGETMLCPATVKQPYVSVLHPPAGEPAMVSPDVSRMDGSSSSSMTSESSSLPSNGAGHQYQQQQQQQYRPFFPAIPTADTLSSKRVIPISPGMQVLAPRTELKPKTSSSAAPAATASSLPTMVNGCRLNKFVRRLHDMLVAEKDSGIVEWRRGLLVLHSTDAFAKKILPQYFNTRNFKTFRRQLNYYGFVHVRSFSTTGSTTTALWVNRDLAQRGSDDIASVLMLKRVEPCEAAKTAEGRRVRKEMAIFTVEEDIGVSPKSLQMEQIRSLAMRAGMEDLLGKDPSLLPGALTQQQGRPSGAPVLLPVPGPDTIKPKRASVPPPFPLLGMKRQVSSERKSQAPNNTFAPRPFASIAPLTTKEESDTDSSASTASDTQEAEPEERITAANLLLMLSQGTRSHRDQEVASAIAPGQFLM